MPDKGALPDKGELPDKDVIPDPEPIDVARAYARIEARLLGFRRRDALLRAAAAAARIGLVAVVLVTFATVLEAAFYLSPAVKTGMWVLAGAGLVFAIGRGVAAPVLRSDPLRTVARRAAAPHGGLHQQLESAIDLWQRRATGAHGESPDLSDAAILHAEAVSRGLDFGVALDRAAPVRRARDLVFAAVVCAVAFLGFLDPMSGAARRLADPTVAYTRPAETYLAVRPGSVTRIEGDTLIITARIAGIVPTDAALFLREAGVDAWSRVPLSVRRDTLAHRIEPVRRTFEYRIEAHDAVSDIHTVTVRPRPVITRIAHAYRYPSYTGLGDRVDDAGGDIVAPEGTRVEVTIEASLPLAEARIVFADGATVESTVSGSAATSVLTVARDDRFTVGLVDTGGVENANPVDYRVVALDDGPPEIRILRPGVDGEIGETMRQPVLLEALDDFGVARTEIRYRLNDDTSETITPVPLDSAGSRSLTQGFLWDLTRLDLLPGDVITYRARAYDANTVSGPSFGESAVFTLRFPSLHEIQEAAMRRQDEDLDTMEETLEAGHELAKRLEEVTRDLLREQDLSWEGRREIEAAVDQQEAMREQIRKTAEALEETIDRLEQSGLMTEATLEKMDEVRELLSAIDSPELRAAMDELRDALAQPDPEAMREALQKFVEQQDAFQKGLDRAIALLKRVRDQQMIDALAQRLSALAEEQEALGERLSDPDADAESLADRQDRLAREAEGLEASMDRAAESLDGAAGQEVARIAEDLDRAEVPDRMNEIADAARAAERSRAGSRSGELQKDLDALAARMQQARDAFARDQKEEVLRDLSRLLQGLITLSRAQEATADRAAESAGGPMDESLARDQARHLAAAGRMAERLLDAGDKTFLLPPDAGASLGRALGKMAEAAGHFQTSSAPQAGRSAREAMAGLNAAALAVREAMGNVRASESGTGFGEMLERMQQLSEGQGELNAQTEGLFGQQQRPGGSTPSMQRAMQQMAAEQRALREMLEQIRKELAGNEGDVLGDLGKVSGDMESVTEALRQRQLTPETVDRQRRILSRLLDAQRSVREQGRSRQREARTGGTVAYRGPGSLPADLGERTDPLRERLRDALREGYGPEYQELIRRYFDRLMKDAVRPAAAGADR